MNNEIRCIYFLPPLPCSVEPFNTTRRNTELCRTVMGKENKKNSFLTPPLAKPSNSHHNILCCFTSQSRTLLCAYMCVCLSVYFVVRLFFLFCFFFFLRRKKKHSAIARLPSDLQRLDGIKTRPKTTSYLFAAPSPSNASQLQP